MDTVLYYKVSIIGWIYLWKLYGKNLKENGIFQRQYCWVRPPEIKTIVMNDCSCTGYNGIKINFWSKLISDDRYNVVLFSVEENFHRQNIEKKFSIEIWCEFILEKKKSTLSLWLNPIRN